MKIYDGRVSFYQWDLKQKITSPDLAIGDEVHYANSSQPNALVLKAYALEDGTIVADVPNILLTRALPIFAYRYIKNGTSEHTKKSCVFEVKSRPKPSDYIYTETEIYTVKMEVEAALREAKESGEFDGKDGKSAYEIAVDNRFKGTEKEWLASLVGSPGEDGKDYVITDADIAKIAQSIDSDTKELTNYAESQNMIKTVTSTYQQRVAGGGLDIVDNIRTTVKRIRNPNYDDSVDPPIIGVEPIKVSGIKSTTKNLTSPANTSYTSQGSNSSGSYADGIVTITGDTTGATGEPYFGFLVNLKAGEYQISGGPSASGYVILVRYGDSAFQSPPVYSTPNRFVIPPEKSGKYSIRCVARKGLNNLNLVYKPMLIKIREGIDLDTFVPYRESILKFPQEYELSGGKYIDFEEEGLSSNSYTVWKDGIETIIGDGKLEVTQSYFVNIDKKNIVDNFEVDKTFRCEEIIATRKEQYDSDMATYNVAFGAKMTHNAIGVENADHQTCLTADELSMFNTSERTPKGLLFNDFLGKGHPDAAPDGYSKLMSFFYGSNKLEIPNANGTLGLAKEIENKFYGYTSGPIYLKENSITFIMTLKNDTHNGLSIFTGDTDSEIIFTHACIVVPKNFQMLEDGSVSDYRRVVCFRLVRVDDTDAEGNVLDTYHYEPKFANVMYTNEGELNIRKAEGNSCATWTIDLG